MKATMAQSKLDPWIASARVAAVAAARVRRRIIIDDSDCDPPPAVRDGSVVSIPFDVPLPTERLPEPLKCRFTTPAIDTIIPFEEPLPLPNGGPEPPPFDVWFTSLPELRSDSDDRSDDDLPDVPTASTPSDSGESGSNVPMGRRARKLCDVFGGSPDGTVLTPLDFNLWKSIPRRSSQYLDLEANHASDRSEGNASVSSGALTDGFISDNDDVVNNRGSLNKVPNSDLKWMEDNLPITVQRCDLTSDLTSDPSASKVIVEAVD